MDGTTATAPTAAAPDDHVLSTVHGGRGSHLVYVGNESTTATPTPTKKQQQQWQEREWSSSRTWSGTAIIVIIIGFVVSIAVANHNSDNIDQLWSFFVVLDERAQCDNHPECTWRCSNDDDAMESRNAVVQSYGLCRHGHGGIVSVLLMRKLKGTLNGSADGLLDRFSTFGAKDRHKCAEKLKKLIILREMPNRTVVKMFGAKRSTSITGSVTSHVSVNLSHIICPTTSASSIRSDSFPRSKIPFGVTSASCVHFRGQNCIFRIRHVNKLRGSAASVTSMSKWSGEIHHHCCIVQKYDNIRRTFIVDRRER